MATHRLQFAHDSGADVYVRLFNDQEQVFDFDDDTWATLAGATTPWLAATETEADNLGTGRSLYGVDIDGDALNGTGALERLTAFFYENAAPAVGDNPISGPLQLAARFGEFFELPVDVVAELSVRTTQGVSAQVAVHLEHGGALVDVGANGGTVFTADAGTDFITSAGHGLTNGQVLLLTSSTSLPGGLALSTPYYVISKTTDTFQVALTAGGSAVDITDTGTGTHKWHRPTATLQVREHGSGVALFTKTFTAADLIDGAFEGEWPEGTVVESVDAGGDTITSTAHGLSNGTIVHLRTGGTLPDPLAVDTDYFVVGATTDTFQLSLTEGGAAIDLTDVGTGTHEWLLATAILTDDRMYELKATVTENGNNHVTRHRRVAIG